MIWLLAQIGFSLLLAAMAGWFVGWYLRAFRDQDRVEDLRQTILATKDVKDRELNELRRRAEDLEAQLERMSETSVRSVATAGATTATAVEIPHFEDQDQDPEPARLVEVGAPSAGSHAEIGEPDELAGVAAAERARRREADAALRRKTSVMLGLQAEIEALRGAVEEKAAEIARLQERLVEAEPAALELETTHAEVAELEARLRASDEERATATAAAVGRDAEVVEARKEVMIRDTRINDLRNRCASLETEVTEARDAATHDGGQEVGQLESGLEDARRALQRQIDRNRKQEAVHRAVVEQLEGDKARLRAAVAPLTDSPTTSEAPHAARRGLPQKPSDELVHISGVGPAFAKALREAGIDTYAQIAAWTDSDIERYATALGAHAKRIRTDRWVEQARELARTSSAQRDQHA